MSGVAFVIKLVGAGDAAIKLCRVLRIFQLNFVLSPTFLRPIHVTIQLAVGQHTELDLPRIFEFALTFKNNRHRGVLWREELPRAVQDALRRLVQEHTHQRAFMELLRFALLDGRINEDQPLGRVRSDAQFQAYFVLRSARVIHAPDVGSLHASEQEISFPNSLDRVHPVVPHFTKKFFRFRKLGRAHIQLHVHRQRVFQVFFEILRQDAIDDVLLVVVFGSPAALDTARVRAVTANDERIRISGASFTFAHAQTRRSVRLAEELLHPDWLHAEIEGTLHQLVLPDDLRLLSRSSLNDCQRALHSLRALLGIIVKQ